MYVSSHHRKPIPPHRGKHARSRDYSRASQVRGVNGRPTPRGTRLKSPSSLLLLSQTSTTTPRFRVSRQPFSIHPLSCSRHSSPQCLLVSSIRPTIRMQRKLSTPPPSLSSPSSSLYATSFPYAYFIALFAIRSSPRPVRRIIDLLRLLVLPPNPGYGVKERTPRRTISRYRY